MYKKHKTHTFLVDLMVMDARGYGSIKIYVKTFNRGKRFELYLEGQFRSYCAVDLVNDLGVKAATVIHVSHHDWKKLDKKGEVRLYYSSYINKIQMSYRWASLRHTSAGPVCFNPTYVAPNL